jgi:hypothetical protein
MRWLIQVAALIGIFTLVPEARSAIVEVAGAVAKVVSSGSGVLKKLKLPELGEDVVPPAVLEIRRIANRQGLAEFRLSPKLAAVPFVLQRVTEGAWPIRYDEDAKAVFLEKAEPLWDGCTLVTSGDLVKHAHCP